MNVTIWKPKYLADATVGSTIRFSDPRNGGTEVTGTVVTFERFDNGRGSALKFTLDSDDPTDPRRMSVNYHIEIAQG